MRNDAFSTISTPFNDQGPGGPLIVAGVIFVFAFGFFIGLFVGDDEGEIRLLKAEQRALMARHSDEVVRLERTIDSLNAQLESCRNQLSKARKK
jgi:hypothetical protein